MARRKPLPSTPIKFSLGILTLSKVIALVALPLIPIFFSGGPAVYPGVFVSTMKVETPFSVLAKTETISAIPPFVIQSFSPFITHSSPSRTALVLTLKESEPADASVKQNAAIFSPFAKGVRYFFFCSSDPPR